MGRGALRGRSRRLSALLLGSFLLTILAFLTRVLRAYTAHTELCIDELERFNGRVAHDVRSPLTVVTFAIETARQRYVLDEAGRAMFDRAGRAVQRVGEVVDAMLVLARAGMPAEPGARADVRAL